MSHAFDVFPSCVHDKLFRTEGSDVCLCLHETWPSLLSDLRLLGPATLLSRSEHMALVSSCRQLDFASVPGTTEMLDLSSGLCLETGALGAVVASQEAQTGDVGFHFFDWEGNGIFKVLLTPEADLDGFAHLARRYAKGRIPAISQGFRCQTALREGAVLAEKETGFQEAWASFDPTLAGDLLPGGKGVGWLDALRLAGRERAMCLTKVGLVKAILAAHRELIRLRITSWQDGLHHEIAVVPERLEEGGQCLHLSESESEAHFFFATDMEIWLGIHGEERMPAIHLFSARGQRRGVVQFAGLDYQRGAWNRALCAAAGVCSDF